MRSTNVTAALGVLAEHRERRRDHAPSAEELGDELARAAVAVLRVEERDGRRAEHIRRPRSAAASAAKPVPEEERLRTSGKRPRSAAAQTSRRRLGEGPRGDPAARSSSRARRNDNAGTVHVYELDAGGGDALRVAESIPRSG